MQSAFIEIKIFNRDDPRAALQQARVVDKKGVVTAFANRTGKSWR
jgi:hypothetical protein